MMSYVDIIDKIDKFLAIYFDSATTGPEKDVAYSMFLKFCKKGNINADQYIKQYKNNRTSSTSSTNNRTNNTKSNTKSSNTKSEKTKNANTKKTYKEYQYDNLTVEDFTEFMTKYPEAMRLFRDFMNSKKSKTKHDDSQDAHRYGYAYNRTNRDDSKKYTQEDKWYQNNNSVYEFEANGLIVDEIGISQNGRRFVKFSANAKRSDEKRFSIQFFSIWSESFDADKHISKDKKYKIVTNKIPYYNKYLGVKVLEVELSSGMFYNIELE